MTATNTTPSEPVRPADPITYLLSLGGLAAKAAAVLWDVERCDLPRPHYLSVSSTGSIGFQFDDDPASQAALARWVQAFGGTITAKHIRRQDGSPATLAQVNFDYDRLPMHAYAVITTATATT